jgi:hypothetical protein
MNMGVIILGVYRILVLKKKWANIRTCIRVSLYCINCAVANLRLDCFISFGVLLNTIPLFVKYYNPVQ